uniref:C1q domain-containing protein n=1 Tax=Esox lucius TaxID=8010 RepID=A0A6Q2X540_ESOLU
MRAITALLMLLLLGLTEADVQNIVTENEISSEKQNIVTENEISSLRQNLVTGSDISPEKQSIVTDSEISPDIQHMEVQRNTSEFQGDSWGSCQPDMCKLLMKIGAMEARMTASESKVDTLHTMNQGLALQLRNTETRLTTTEIELRNTETRLSTSEKQVEELKENAVKEQVVFSAGFGFDGNYGPFNTVVNLVYKKVFINIGNGYNQNTGTLHAEECRHLIYSRS